MARRGPGRLRDHGHRHRHRRARRDVVRRAGGRRRADPARDRRRHERGHREQGDRGKPGVPRPVKIDVFSLFPDWFDFFRGQRHVQNATADGLEFDTVSYRDTTPLTGGQVDDTPYGGGAGMVIRVDVVEAALEARYGGDAAELRDARRVIAFAAGGRQFDDALADELAAEEALSFLCGRYEGLDE